MTQPRGSAGAAGRPESAARGVSPSGADGVGSGWPLPTWLRDILRCPVGRHPLVEATTDSGGVELICAEDCGTHEGRPVRRAYRVEDGIPVLLADEARLITATG